MEILITLFLIVIIWSLIRMYIPMAALIVRVIDILLAVIIILVVIQLLGFNTGINMGSLRR